ncbi:MAG: tRNA (guanosine(46)-N7)-methyltransferase TrmB [Gammaproteobacteria bacterium]|nr:tRNA (guanosine(46)-N7)-methyltransferase TrmB [Gammaproteobacteria bacterium]
MTTEHRPHGNGPSPNTETGPRPIRSYVIRSGRLTSSQRKAIDNYWQDYVIEYQTSPLALNALFHNKADTVLEIGFGMGDSLLEMAINTPSVNFLGVEVHKPGIGKLLHGIAEAGLDNLKVINHDAKEVLLNCFEDESLWKIQIFFPDPWHKKRHNKRRLIQDEFVQLLASKLKVSGELHLATDWEPYAEHMLEKLDTCEMLVNSAGPACYSASGDRPVTRFENRGKKLGHKVRDLRYVKS